MSSCLEFEQQIHHRCPGQHRWTLLLSWDHFGSVIVACGLALWYKEKASQVCQRKWWYSCCGKWGRLHESSWPYVSHNPYSMPRLIWALVFLILHFICFNCFQCLFLPLFMLQKRTIKINPESERLETYHSILTAFPHLLLPLQPLPHFMLALHPCLHHSLPLPTGPCVSTDLKGFNAESAI